MQELMQFMAMHYSILVLIFFAGVVVGFGALTYLMVLLASREAKDLNRQTDSTIQPGIQHPLSLLK